MNQQELERLAEILPALDSLEGKTPKLSFIFKEVGESAVRVLLDQRLESKERLMEMVDEFSLIGMDELAAIVHEYVDGAVAEDDPSNCPYEDEAGKRAWFAKMERSRASVCEKPKG
jgi:hypothetical protein